MRSGSHHVPSNRLSKLIGALPGCRRTQLAGRDRSLGRSGDIHCLAIAGPEPSRSFALLDPFANDKLVCLGDGT